jgi:hypothetical protein
VARYAIVCLAALSAAPFLGNGALARHRDFTTMSPFEEEGRPVTAKDVAGRKFCWNTGHWGYFMADGSFTSDRREYFQKRPGHWQVLQPGVIRIGYSERQAEILPGGQLHEYWYALAHGKEKGTKSHDRDLWGTVCN